MTNTYSLFVASEVQNKFGSALCSLPVLVCLALILLSGFAEAHNPGGESSFHINAGGHALPTERCRTTEECMQMAIALEAPAVGCMDPSPGYSLLSKYYNSHWSLRSIWECDFGGSQPQQFQYNWIWGLPLPAECQETSDGPICEHTGPEFFLDTDKEPPPPQVCPDPNQEKPTEVAPTQTNPTESNPCDPATGNKFQVEVDYASTGSGSLSFSRFYNSLGPYKSDPSFANGWRHTYSKSLDGAPDVKAKFQITQSSSGQSSFYTTAADACTSGWTEVAGTAWAGALSGATASFKGGNVCQLSSGGNIVAEFSVRSATGWPGFTAPTSIKTLIRPAGNVYRFENNGGSWESALHPEVTLQQSGSNWVFTDTDDTEETYNASGQLVSITYRNGQTETLYYTLSPAQGGDGDNGTLDRVTGPFGHEITFSYTAGRLDSVTTPDGSISYAYVDHDNLDSATYPNSTSRHYLYDSVVTAGATSQLIGLIDENGVQFATWDYDTSGRAVLSEHADGKERVELAYNADGSTTLTMANGASRTYSYSVEQGHRKISALTGNVCSTCAGGQIKDRSYDANGFLSETTDWEGNVRQFTRNSRGLVEGLTEAVGTAVQRTTSTTWHSQFRLPTQVSTPKNTTTYTHDGNGNVLTATVAGGSLTRSWGFTYNPGGQLLTIDGPRTDVTDVTTLEYYSCTTGAECGQLKKVTNALGHDTNYDSYDAAGRLTQMTGPNGLQMSYTYDARGRLLTSTETPTVGAARTTTRTYDNAGQLATLTLPSGTLLSYTYSDAHYLTRVTDNLGNYVEYDYDGMGSLISEESYDPTSSLAESLALSRDLNYRLDAVTHGPVTTDLTYDLVGNLIQETDGNLNQTQHGYDALNRLDSTTDALLGVVTFDYDAHDNLLQVNAANGATTDFVYDALDNLLSETSPDRGSVTYTYDDAGNRLGFYPDTTDG